LANHVPIIKFVGMMWINVLLYIWNLNKLNHKWPMLGKKLGFKKGQKRKGVTNKRSATKPTKSTQHHGGKIHMPRGITNEHGSIREIKCACFEQS
jgi:hypothetical protein